LEKQINSQLFERLLMSNDVQAVVAVAREGKISTDAKEILEARWFWNFFELKEKLLITKRI